MAEEKIVSVTWSALDPTLQMLLIGTTVTAVGALLLSFLALCKTFGGVAGCLRLGAAAAKGLADTMEPDKGGQPHVTQADQRFPLNRGYQTLAEGGAPSSSSAAIAVSTMSLPPMPPPPPSRPPAQVHNLNSLRQPSAEILLSRLNNRATTTPHITANRSALPPGSGPSTRATPKTALQMPVPPAAAAPPAQPNFAATLESPPLPSVSRATPVPGSGMPGSASPRNSSSPDPTMSRESSCVRLSGVVSSAPPPAFAPEPVPAYGGGAAPPMQLPPLDSLQPRAMGSDGAKAQPTQAQSDAAANLIAGLRAAAARASLNGGPRRVGGGMNASGSWNQNELV
jgi:hypothetical protein